jgi:anti-anti-sigma regulatory factor
MNKVSLIDASGIHSLKDFADQCKAKSVIILLSGVDHKKEELLRRSGLETKLPAPSIFHTFQEALKEAKVRLDS